MLALASMGVVLTLFVVYWHRVGSREEGYGSKGREEVEICMH